ncbi:MAG: tyrosine--tRNA ligase [Solirubrobacterales bacterium]|nr:tyrosine--tRNA ligase [Solirubrobacterales bacterium]
MGNATDAAAQDAARLAERLAWGTVDCLPEGALAARLRAASEQGRVLRVKLGIDPTAPDIHLGHAVVLRKLREFQDAGHRVVLIIGDYTARVGDPSGRSSLRPILSGEQIEANAATFQEQALRILDPDPERLEVRRNSEWLDMSMIELLGLMRTTTAAQMLERDDFAKRFAAGEPISMLELLYPLLQGYDSVAVKADVELGGTDQKFNLLLGRDIQRAYGEPEQAILTMGILVGTDGQRKMSKSLGNQIGVTDAPEEMFGKTMAIPDEAMGQYYRLLLGEELGAGDGDTAGAGAESDAAGTGPATGETSARDAKRALARGIVAWLYTEAEAEAAERHFERVFVQREAPEEIEEAHFASEEGMLHLPGLIAEEFGISRSEARRLIDQGGVSLGEEVLGTDEHNVASERADGQVLKVGKRRFRRLRAGM